ncbi:MAG: hypothetical protein WCX16_02210 [Candidatus Omnitrophota bacterium]
MEDKKFFYNQARIFGASAFILLSLVTGPLAGYFLGDFLVQKFSWPAYVVFVCISIGFLSSIFEIVRIAKFLLKREAS